MVYHNSDDFKRDKSLSTLDKIDFNGHAYISGDYETKESELVVFCITYEVEHCTTFTNYCRSKTGMPCCGKLATSKKLLGRNYSRETLDKMRQAALNRIRLPSIGQDWRRSAEARIWEKEVKNMWNKECPISGNQANLVMHHFFSGARYEKVELRDTLLYHVNNGILITKELHVDFHKIFGYERNTIEQFQIYVENLQKLISSQAHQKWWEGSETRVDDPHLANFKSIFRAFSFVGVQEKGIEKTALLEKIMKLHERLGEVRKELRTYDV